MSARLDRTLGALLAAGLTVSIAALSHVPYVASPGEDAQIRLAWRYRSERVEECRRLTPEELQRLPVHMRREQVCEGEIRPYRLDVKIDDVRVAPDTIRATGAHADRPLYVFREFRVAPGRHRVEIAFTPEGSAPSEDREARAAAPGLELETDVVLGPREVALVTYDAEMGKLVVRGRTP